MAHAEDLEMVQERFLSGLQALTEPDAPQPATPDSWPSLNQEALTGLAGDVVRVLEPHTEADPAALLVACLSEFGAMIGRAPHIELDGSYHPLLFWPILVGASSKARKGSSDNRIRHVMQLADHAWTRGEQKGTLSSGEGLAFAVRDPQYKEEPIKHNGKPTGETQSICVDPGVTDKRLLLVQSEFGAVLRVMARDGNALSGVLRDAWDGQTLSPMTKANRICATNPHIAIVGHVTRDELLKNLNETDAFNGFGNRFVWFLVRRSKELPFSSNPTPSDLDPIVERLRRAIQAARTVSAIQLTDEAKADWRKIYSDLSGDRPGLVGSLLARSEAQVMRLAALYALINHRPQIEDGHLRAALALWAYAEDSTNQLFSEVLGDPDASRIYREIQAKGELADTDISALFGHHRSQSRLAQSKDLLRSTGRAHPESRQTAGRPRRVWVLGRELA